MLTHIMSVYSQFEKSLADYYDAIDESRAERCSPVDLSFYRERAENKVAHLCNLWIKVSCSDAADLREESKKLSDEARILMDKAMAFERRSLKRAAV